MNEILSFDGIRIACRRGGNGPPLLLVHGSLADSSHWEPVMPALAESHTVYAIDRAGHGASGRRSSYRIEDESSDIAACLAVIADGPANLVAHSYGALCALGAVKLGARIRRLVLFEPPIPVFPEAYYPSHLIETMRAAIVRGDCDSAMAEFAACVFHWTPEQLEQMRPLAIWREMTRDVEVLFRELEAVDRFELRPEGYRDWTTPVLLLLGGSSPPQYRATIGRLHEVLAGSRIGVLEGCRHDAMKTAPQVFVRAIAGFLSETSC